MSCLLCVVLNSSYLISNEKNSSLFTQLLSNCKDVYFREKSRIENYENKNRIDSQFEHYKTLCLNELIINMSEDEKVSYKYNFDKYVFENINEIVKGIKMHEINL